MQQTFAEKALARAARLDHVVAGQIVDVTPDVVLSHDNSAAIARIFRGLGVDRVKYPERLAITLDHAVPAPTTLHASNHAEIRGFVAKQGIEHFFDAGRGICHQVLSEEALVLPGQLILGADSHTTHFGWLGAFGAGVGRSEVAAIWATGELWLRVPESIRIELTGELPPWVTAKDLALHILQLLGSDQAVYRSLEFGGPGLTSLSLESRMVIPNMMAEAGAKNAYLEPDEAVFGWLAERVVAGRGARWSSRELGGARGSWEELGGIRRSWEELGGAGGSLEELRGAWGERLATGALYPDPDAAYVARYTIDLGQLEPMIACPHSPANAVPVSQVAGTRVDQAFLGTCTNGRLEDLAAAAAVLRGSSGQVRRVASGTRLLVIPASSQVLQDALAAGYIDIFLAAGAMIGTPGCGPCMGNHMGIPAPGEVTISTANRNFRGRMGTAESDVYLASPAVVAASAVAGRIVDPREVVERRAADSGSADGGVASRQLVFQRDASVPAEFSMTTTSKPKLPASQPVQQATHRPINQHFLGRVWKYGDDVNTDVIFPGKYTYTLRKPAEWAQHALEDLDPNFAASVQPGDIIVGGRNWGCGSSREQAVGCLVAAGVKAIIAISFARIYYRNAVNNGLLPIICPEAVEAIQPGETVSIDLERRVVRCAAGEFSFPPLSPSLGEIVAAGGLISMLKNTLCP